MTAKKPTSKEFERSLTKGHSSYNQRVGVWWDSQANNRAHKTAYKNICNYIYKSLPVAKRKPKWILDYACGNGLFLKELAKKFPKANIVGLDGSKLMLEFARDNLSKIEPSIDLVDPSDAFKAKGPRIRLCPSILPNFKDVKNICDLAIFLFPNLTCAPKERPVYYKNGYRNPKDTEMGEMLARFREMDPEDEVDEEDEEENYDDYMTNRVISRNLRAFMKRGGYLFRSDYANAPREELTDLTQWRTLFSECALNLEIKGERSEILFEYLGSEYRRSSVILDVYDQTKDPSDKEGGFFTSYLKAV